MDTMDVEQALGRLRERFPPELVAQLLAAARGELADKRRQLAEALATDQADPLRRCAHSLKSTAGAIGLDSLARHALATEQAPDETLASSAQSLLDEVVALADLLAAREGPP